MSSYEAGYVVIPVIFGLVSVAIVAGVVYSFYLARRQMKLQEEMAATEQELARAYIHAVREQGPTAAAQRPPGLTSTAGAGAGPGCCSGAAAAATQRKWDALTPQEQEAHWNAYYRQFYVAHTVAAVPANGGRPGR